MIFEPVIAVGWRALDPKKGPQPLLVLYCGDDVEAACTSVNAALDERTIAYGRVFRGQLMGGQLMYAASPSNRPPAAPSPVLPATGRLP